MNRRDVETAIIRRLDASPIAHGIGQNYLVAEAVILSIRGTLADLTDEELARINAAGYRSALDLSQTLTILVANMETTTGSLIKRVNGIGKSALSHPKSHKLTIFDKLNNVTDSIIAAIAQNQLKK